MSGLRVRGLGVARADGSVALQGVTLDVAPGEVLTVVGPSGCGKTTLLRAVAGLVPATGTVELDDRDVTHLRTEERNVAMVFEAGALLSFLDVAQNVGFGLTLRHVPAAEREERVAAEARRLRIGALLGRRPDQLSGGERGRADIGRAFVRRPSAWLLDEPLAHLDPPERFTLRHRLVREAKRHGVPTLYVTHDPAEALAAGDQVAVMQDGRIVQVGAPGALYRSPATVFVAAFLTAEPLGILPARVVASGYRVGDRTLPLWSGLPAVLEPYLDASVLLALRPEDVTDARLVDDPDVARMTGLVTATEFTGPSVMATVQLDVPPAVGPALGSWFLPGERASLVVRLPSDHPVTLAGDLALAFDAGRAHVFDATTGAALWHPPHHPRADHAIPVDQ